MTVYLNRRARYSKGTLKLRAPLKLPEGAEVRVTVTALEPLAKRRAPKPKHTYPTVALPPGTLAKIDGLVSLGGDAVADGEALYEGD